MKKLYLVNFATNDDWECAVDDGVRGLWETCIEMAEPTGIVTTDLDAAAQTFLNDTMALMYEEHEATGDEPPTIMQWVKVSDTRWNLIFHGGVGGVMIIRHVGTCDNFTEATR